LIALLVIGLAGLSAGFASATNVQTVHVMTVKPRTEILDLPPRGKSPGVVYVVDGTSWPPTGAP
jgi:hypothetical protein